MNLNNCGCILNRGQAWGRFIYQIMREFRLTEEEIASKAGLRQPTINRMKQGQTDSPYPSTIKALEEGLKIKIDDTDPQNITYRKLFSEDIEGKQEPYTIGQNKYPILSQVHGGSLLNEEEVGGYAYFPYHKKENCYVLKVKEDSLNGIVKYGDLILIDKDARINNNDIVIVKFKSGGQTIKRFRRITDEIIQLYIGVPGYEPEEHKYSEIEIIQKVVGKWETF
jgi:SOS-response transcriptional repressor LexA